jgi:hypothetical protein
MPESTLSLCQSLLYILVRDYEFGLRVADRVGRNQALSGVCIFIRNREYLGKTTVRK